MKKLHIIDTDALTKAVEKSTSSKDEIANEIGVSTNTLKRWMGGQIKSVKEENLTRLCNCLNVDLLDIIISEKSNTLELMNRDPDGSPAIYDNLFLKLFNMNKWGTIEQAFISILSPAIPNWFLEKIYAYAASLSMFSGKYDMGIHYCEKLIKLGQTGKSRSPERKGHIIKGALLTLKGQMAEGLTVLESGLSIREDVWDLDEACFHQHLGFWNRLQGNFEISIDQYKMSQGYVSKIKNPFLREVMKMANVFYTADIYMELGDFQKAQENLDRLSQVSSKLLNNRIRALSDIMIAVNQSLIGNKINLEKLLYSVDFFKESETLYSYVHYCAARSLRKQGDLETAKEILKLGLKAEGNVPCGDAHLYFEKAMIAYLEGNNVLGDLFLEKTTSLCEKLGAFSRIEKWKAELEANNISVSARA